MLETISAFAYRHSETKKKNLYRGGLSQQFCVSCVYVHWLMVLIGHLRKYYTKIHCLRDKFFCQIRKPAVFEELKQIMGAALIN